MDLQLTGKRALISGSTLGIGFSIAKALAAEGASVILNGRSAERLGQATRTLEKELPGAKVSSAVGDLGTARGASAVIETAGDIDILVNNAGIFEPKAFESIPDEDWLRMFEVNVMSGVRLSRHYFPQMKSRQWGRIVFISSESALQIPMEMIHYGMAKTAQLSIARGLAELSAGSGVTVNSVLPGPTMSEGVGTFVEQLAARDSVSRGEIEKRFFQHERPSSLLKRFIEPTEIASVVTFICSPLSSSINGAAIRAEGGVLRAIA